MSRNSVLVVQHPGQTSIWCTVKDTEGGCVRRRQIGFAFDTELKQRDDRYDLNHLRTWLWISNQDERRVIKMSWSIVSKAADRSSSQRQDTFLLH